jgi:hypothetical protein
LLGGLCKLFKKKKKGVCTQTCTVTTECCCADPCEIAKLIYESQTACYADDREQAIDDLGDYDCRCNPEILTAMVYALNDADEEVRAEGADELGDQFRDNPCCCSKEIISALTCALGDCDDDVVSEAEEALEACGYCIVDGCCEETCCSSCGGSGCNSCNSNSMPSDGSAPAPQPEPSEDAAPAPAPPEAYFPSRLRQRHTERPVRRNNKLANLFGLLN